VRLARELEAIPLERTQIVRVSELRTKLLEDGPVALLALAAGLALQMAPEIGGNAIVV